MAEMLDKIDRQIDVNAMIVERCLDTVVKLINPHLPPAFYGAEMTALQAPGVCDLTKILVESVRADMKIADMDDKKMDQMIAEYAEEKKKIAANPPHATFATVAEVTLDPKTPVPVPQAGSGREEEGK